MVSLLVNSGVPLPVVGKIVGHSDATTTSRIYTHIESTAEINAKKDGKYIKVKKITPK